LLIVRLKEREAAAARAGSVRPLQELLASDTGFAPLLQAAMARTQSLVEIAVTGRSRAVVASSNPLRPRAAMPEYRQFRELRDRPPWQRVVRVLDAGESYELTVPLGVAGDAAPVFTIHVLISPVLLRAQVIPAMKRVARWGVAALLSALVLVWFSTRLVTRNLMHLSSVIDRIGRGEQPEPPRPARSAAREFAIIESKLNVLGHQFRGAEKLRHAVETVLEGLQEAFLVFDGDGRLSLAGGPVRRMLGQQLSGSRGNRIDEVFPRDSELGTTLLDAFRDRRPLQDRLVDGRLLLSLEFGPATALVRIRDAAAETHLERQLGTSVRADGMSRIMGAVAHEIKNPLNSICVRLDNLQAWANEEHPEMEDEIQIILEEVNRLDRVVRTFLDLTRPAELMVEDVDMAALCREIAALLQPEAESRAVRIELSAPRDGPVIAGDHDMLKEAVINVVSNGLEAMPDGGTLRVSVTGDRLGCVVRVSDSGAGIPDLVREQMFDPYFTTKPNGTGLGLPRTLRAVQLHGGAVEVASAPGKGADVSLRFPAKV
jgi:signal transduction histidine kinase